MRELDADLPEPPHDFLVVRDLRRLRGNAFAVEEVPADPLNVAEKARKAVGRAPPTAEPLMNAKRLMGTAPSGSS
jgi:hypothetical protein